MKFLKRHLTDIILLLVLALVAFYFREPLYKNVELAVKNINQALAPCSQPIAYSLGNVDQRFGLSNSDLSAAVAQAANIWSSAAGRQLFIYQPDGALKINFIYDYRQEATDKLKKLGIVLSGDRNSYDSLKAKYLSSQAEYSQQKIEIANLKSDFSQKQAAYEAEVQYWNAQHGAPPDIYNKLQQEKAQLDQLASKINQQISGLNDLVDSLNAEATILNKLISELNLDVTKYNTTGSQVQGEFDEGLYVQDAAGQHIDIYQFNDHQQLVRLLAHELGHALGLDHTDNPNDIMYRLNQSNNIMPTANDIASIKNVCRIK